eukprot:TRINITY_DN206_c1_g1_i16.p3 TRINITY_DN206_c1_g1~~TRINITY_DN206_c1_g1_i16.p3  ORF type:complete len:120 (-),score=25.79 TRINITY_DN206_c1_g1_i16:283-642(-)
MWNYYEIEQLPNFLLAAPIVIISFFGSWKYFSYDWKRTFTLGLMPTPFVQPSNDRLPQQPSPPQQPPPPSPSPSPSPCASTTMKSSTPSDVEWPGSCSFFAPAHLHLEEGNPISFGKTL